MNEAPTLNKQRLCRQLAKQTGYSTRLVTEVIEALLDALEAHLVAAGRVEFQNVLVLEMRKKRRQTISESNQVVTPHWTLKARMGQRLRHKLRAASLDERG